MMNDQSCNRAFLVRRPPNHIKSGRASPKR